MANPEQVKQIELRQRVANIVTKKQKGHPILFGYNIGDKYTKTIFAIDRENYEVKEYESDQINLQGCDLVQVQDSLYSFGGYDFTRYHLVNDSIIP